MKNQNNKIISSDVSKEMKDSYLDYAMSVIVSRALPDVRDGAYLWIIICNIQLL